MYILDCINIKIPGQKTRDLDKKEREIIYQRYFKQASIDSTIAALTSALLYFKIGIVSSGST